MRASFHVWGIFLFRPIVDFQLNFIIIREHTVHDFSSFTFVKVCFTSQEMAVYLGVLRALGRKARLLLVVYKADPLLGAVAALYTLADFCSVRLPAGRGLLTSSAITVDSFGLLSVRSGFAPLFSWK